MLMYLPDVSLCVHEDGTRLLIMYNLLHFALWQFSVHCFLFRSITVEFLNVYAATVAAK
jgi:hypothetical protein